MARVRRSGSGGSVFPDFSVYNDATHKIKCQDMWTNIPTDNGWSSARLNIQTDIKDKLVDSNTFKYFEAPEDCFVCAQGHFSTAANSNAENGIMFMVAESKDAEYAYKYSGWDQSQLATEFAATIPLRKGNIVFGLSDGLYGSDVYTWWVPMSATPAKISELYMGAPDWSKTITLFSNQTTPPTDLFDLPDSGTPKTGTYTVPSNGWVRVFCSAGPGLGTNSLSLEVNGVAAFSFSNTHEDDSDPNTLIPVAEGDELSLSFTSGGTAISFIPRKKIRIDASDIVASSSGGVLDGSLYTLSNGLTYKEVTDVAIEGDSAPAALVYTVENDCGLYMEDEAYEPSGTIHSDIECRYWFDSAKTKPIFKHNQVDESWIKNVADGTMDVKTPDPEAVMGFQGTTVYVKAGTKIYASSSHYTTSGMGHISHRFRFYEYKLSSIAPQIAMPDYSRGVTRLKASGTNAASGGYVMPANGWIVSNIHDLDITTVTASLGSARVLVNGVTVAEHHVAKNYTSFDDQMQMRPVSKGDVVTLAASTSDESDITKYATLDFIYAKTVQSSSNSTCISYVAESGRFCSSDGTVHATASENDAWYRLYSDGWCEQGGYGKSGDTTIMLLKSYSGTNYNCNLIQVGASAQADHHDISAKSSNAITIHSSVVSATLDWKTEGFIATT